MNKTGLMIIIILINVQTADIKTVFQEITFMNLMKTFGMLTEKKMTKLYQS